MLTIPLPEYKRRLEEMLLDLQLLVVALKELRDLLPETAEKRATVLNFLGRINDANTKALRGSMDQATLQVTYNGIRSDLADFIQALEEVDFDASAKSEPGGNKTGAQQGSVLYRIPHLMPLGEETMCVVRIAIDENAIVEDIIIDEQVALKDLSRVSDLMQVELCDPAKEPVFHIRSTSAEQQLITEEGFSQWNFYVEPLRTGVHPLEVKVSVLELAFNQVHRKELVFRETIQIVTSSNKAPEAPPESDEVAAVEGPGFKHAGTAFAFAGAAPIQQHGTTITFDYHGPSNQPDPSINTPSTPSGLRTAALFMAFILLGSTATWAFTPPETRDWWVASLVKDDETAYAAFIEKYPTSPYREKALYSRAERSQKLAHLQAYQREFGASGKYRDRVSSKIATLETKALDDIRQNPRRENIQQFAVDFPETERLSDLKQLADNRAENRAELLSAVEDAYITSARSKPTEQKVKAYLRDFQQPKKLDEMVDALAANQEVKAKVQGDLEEVYLKRMEKNLTTAEANDFLDKFPDPVNKDKFEEVLGKKPAVKKEAVKKMRLLEEAKDEKMNRKDQGLGQVTRSGIDLQRIDGGMFTMGSPTTDPGRSDDECEHPVEVRPFFIAKYEVTQADWLAIMGTRPSNFHQDGSCNECPVEQVSWNSVQIFLKKLNAKYPGKNYRLPTEAEWEFAARGGIHSKKYTYAGSNDLSAVAWQVDNSGGKTHPVGSLAPNELGLYDMSGNVWEWCQDKYDPYANCAGVARESRVVRGGSFIRKTRSLRPAFRNAELPTQRATGLGFRLAASL